MFGSIERVDYFLENFEENETHDVVSHVYIDIGVYFIHHSNPDESWLLLWDEKFEEVESEPLQNTFSPFDV